MLRRNRERVGRAADRRAESADAGITEVIQVQVRRIVGLVVRGALDVTCATECGVNRDGEATRRAAGVREGPLPVILRARESAARACLAGASARHAIAAESIGLRRVSRRE